MPGSRLRGVSVTGGNSLSSGFARPYWIGDDFMVVGHIQPSATVILQADTPVSEELAGAVAEVIADSGLRLEWQVEPRTPRCVDQRVTAVALLSVPDNSRASFTAVLAAIRRGIGQLGLTLELDGFWFLVISSTTIDYVVKADYTRRNDEAEDWS